VLSGQHKKFSLSRIVLFGVCARERILRGSYTITVAEAFGKIVRVAETYHIGYFAYISSMLL
jgi:hypothetical protein